MAARELLGLDEDLITATADQAEVMVMAEELVFPVLGMQGLASWALFNDVVFEGDVHRHDLMRLAKSKHL